MSPYSTNPLLHEYALLQELHISPELLEDQEIYLPSFRQVFKWLLGKPLSLTLRRGLEAKKVDLLLSLVDQKRQEEKVEQEKIESESRRIRSDFG